MIQTATPKQIQAISNIVSNRSGIKPWSLSDEKAIEFLNDYLQLELDDTRTLGQQLTLPEASNILTRLIASQ